MATKKSTAAKSTPAKSAPAKAPTKTAAKKTAAEKSAAKPASAAASAETAATPKSPATREQIAELAHKYYTERGHHHGSHTADWLRAEKELNS